MDDSLGCLVGVNPLYIYTNFTAEVMAFLAS